MPKTRCGKEELHVLLRALTDNMDYREGGGEGVPIARLKYSMHVIKSLQTFINSDLFCLGLECFDVIG